MRIAIPIVEGKLSMHFGHCEKFALVDADPETKQVQGIQEVAAPPHQPGLLPPWLAERGTDMIIAGGMGLRAQQLFSENGIRVVVGAPSGSAQELAAAYLEGTLEAGDNICDH